MEEENKNEEVVSGIDKNQILLKILSDLKIGLESAIKILGGDEGMERMKTKIRSGQDEKDTGKIIEGVFAGDKMVGADGASYNIPQNYASKSKLLEGDILKLTVTPSGNFIYKQVGHVPRKRLMGELIVDEEQEEYWVATESEKWRVLKASATYFKGQTGDRVAFLLPEDAPAKWAAVENIIKNDQEGL
ncbi:MAG: hypothetical protein COU51_02120 [Parcubacteria group bacterium CG10_big_fil_rev_8_21_14_0_10_36_14]|nr:MAG: hypothetical protein COU51_02120 [Parcubacteria group bacterium CG10_big_fil_rev_8_21_14_0_10_36_14]